MRRERERVLSSHLVVNNGGEMVALRNTRQYGSIVRRKSPARRTILIVTHFKELQNLNKMEIMKRLLR